MISSHSLEKAVAEVGRRRKDRKWKGYTLSQLRTQRVIVQARILIEKNRLEMAYDDVRMRRTRDKSILRRVLGALTVIDYGIMAAGIYKRVSAIVSHLRSNRRED